MFRKLQLDEKKTQKEKIGSPASKQASKVARSRVCAYRELDFLEFVQATSSSY